MRIGVLGGGPAGLYFALLMKRLDPAHVVTVVEQNPRDATYGFGVVFALSALRFIEEGDPEVFAALRPSMESWSEQTIVHRSETVRIDGNGFAAIGRLALLQILHRLCEDAGVTLRFGTPVDSLDRFADCDLVVGADGVNSLVRGALPDRFAPAVRELGNRFVWYGTSQVFDTLTLTFRRDEAGAFVAHHYRYCPGMSTFLVECNADTWVRAGFAEMSDEASRAYCARVFAEDLGGHALVSNKSVWRRFPVITNRRWHDGRHVLIGDALRTVHFSIGSGTRLAIEDAIALARACAEAGPGVPAILDRFEATRRPIVEKMMQAAAGSYEWYEGFDALMELDPFDLAYSYMTRSGRMPHERLREIAPRFVAAYERRRGKAAGGTP